MFDGFGSETRRLLDRFVAAAIKRVEEVPASGPHHETARAERIGH